MTEAKKNAKIIGRTITPRATVPATKTPIAATTTKNRHATPDEIAKQSGGDHSSMQSSMVISTTNHCGAPCESPVTVEAQPCAAPQHVAHAQVPVDLAGHRRRHRPDRVVAAGHGRQRRLL